MVCVRLCGKQKFLLGKGMFMCGSQDDNMVFRKGFIGERFDLDLKSEMNFASLRRRGKKVLNKDIHTSRVIETLRNVALSRNLSLRA